MRKGQGLPGHLCVSTLQVEANGEAAEAAQEAEAAPAAEAEPEADKEEWQQIEVPIEWQPRPMFKVDHLAKSAASTAYVV